jgi:phenylalanyl-tRNA synthetase beta chain
MKLSLDWLREYVALPADLDPRKLAHDLTMSTVEVEHVTDLGAALAQVVVARVESCAPHPNADSLQVCALSDGRTVVCGGSNVVAGMKVALALPGAVVRGRDGKPQTIADAAVRGVPSSGMLCSAGELGLADLFPSQGKEIIDLSGLDVPLGTPLAQAIGFDDLVIEIDNKSLTNRPDLWGHYGIARELAALYGLDLRPLPTFTPPASGGIDVEIADPRGFRYTATRVEGVDVRPSPLWMRARLAKVGQRPINLPVDLTNYVMMAVGQPSHAFDARDLVAGVQVRAARDGEAITLLDGTALTLDPSTLVIASGDDALALAGVMGGERAVRADTTALWLEVASFDHVDIRKTGRRLGLRTESSSRFEKGVDTARVETALAVFQALLADLLPNARLTAHVDVHPRPTPPVTLSVTVDFLHRRLGRDLGAPAIRALLARLGFEAEGEDTLSIRVPPWRATGDVDLPEDIVEEVGRLYGFEKLGFSPPIVALEQPVIQPRRRMERRLKEYLAFRCGLREIVTYPWVARRLREAAGQLDVPSIGLHAPPAQDMRLATSLVPQLLDAVVGNGRYFDEFGIFELNRVFLPEPMDGPEALPHQPRHLAAAFVGPDAGALFYRAKGALEGLARAVQVHPITFADPAQVPGWADPAAVLAIQAAGRTIGHLGVLSARARRIAGVRRGEAALFELDVEALEPFASRENRYAPLPAHPQVDFDISVIVGRDVRFAALSAAAADADALVQGVRFVDEYTGAPVPEGQKSVTLRLRLGAADRTLVREQIDAAAGAVIQRLASTFGGQVRAG